MPTENPQRAPLPEAESPPPAPGIRLAQIVHAEIEVINRRRERLGRTKVADPKTGPGAPALDVVGLALSGGGIRSAAFSLGVLQSLNEHQVLQRVDYLSTVSGGGYMGTSLTTTMTKTRGGFVFGRSTGPRVSVDGQGRPPDVMDSGSVGHLRNYSNYLIPRGARDLLATALAIVVRGLVANLALVLPVVLIIAALTILGNPSRSDLTQPDLFGYSLEWLPVRYFGLTLLAALVGLVLFLLWAIYRSCLPPDEAIGVADLVADARGRLSGGDRGLLLLRAATVRCERHVRSRRRRALVGRRWALPANLGHPVARRDCYSDRSCRCLLSPAVGRALQVGRQVVRPKHEAHGHRGQSGHVDRRRCAAAVDLGWLHSLVLLGRYQRRTLRRRAVLASRADDPCDCANRRTRDQPPRGPGLSPRRSIVRDDTA
ncbi:MAG: patatin-like phospholipase family protein [Hyphomicrobiales bacterium]|nr:patatin-like phospholipase family protein [Hyphomicrobiales bacterium]